ncbi:MAG TPA: cation-transporting P-type ATPase [Terriglobia bacterium]|nr:cation-transporting P-type ATPase [Terriglobia bacterium]
MKGHPHSSGVPLPATTKAHGLSVSEILQGFSTGPEGLSELEARRRLQQFGPNTLERARAEPPFRKLAANFTHLMAVLLWIAGAVAFAARLPELGIAIWAVNIINGLFSFWQEYRAQRAIQALRLLLPQKASVIRAGVEQTIPAEEVVPGDLILLNEGDNVPADARVVLESGLRIDQSTLTGESRPVRKVPEVSAEHPATLGELPNVVFAGTSVVAGHGRAIVITTGMNTEFGKIAYLTQTLREEPSPLQKELVHVTRVIAYVATGFGLIFFLLALLLGTLSLGQSSLFTLGMIVAFVPEGLLPTLTLALAMAVQRMARRNALVKRLSSVETLGCATVICTDKTGTLTRNEMTVTALWVPDTRFEVTGTGYRPQGRILQENLPISPVPETLRELLLAGSFCNNARLIPGDQWSISGDPTEAAVLVAAAKAGLDMAAELTANPRVREIAFDSLRKKMTTIQRHHKSGTLTAYTKGAPKELLQLCLMSPDQREKALRAYDDLARAGLRVLAAARRTVPPDLPLESAEIVEKELTFLGLIAMMDPPRDEVPEAISRCHTAGIRMVMITGDYGVTAEAIARRIGMLRPGPVTVLNGFEIDAMGDESLQVLLQNDVVVARATPLHKLRVVRAFQNLGHIVAVTGDGVNDAPALKKANIGIAMGRGGTDVARNAADIVLLDNNFASIVNAVEEGRAVYSNIRKFITYILTSNTPEAAPFICFAFSAGRIPLALNMMQILSIDLGTDMAPALALGAEAPEPGMMEMPPRPLHQHLFTPGLLLRAYAWLGPPQAVLTMLAFYATFWADGYWGQWLDLPSQGHLYHQAASVALASVVATQIGNVFTQRSERIFIRRIGLGGNPLIWVGILFEIAVLAVVLYVPALQLIFGTSALPASSLWLLLAMIPALPLVDEFRKAVAKNLKPAPSRPR